MYLKSWSLISLLSERELVASIPACTAGCKVFTLPPSISGAPVTSLTSLQGNFQFYKITFEKNNRKTYLTSIPASLIFRAVPPEAINSIPSLCNLSANVIKPVLLETLRIAETNNKKLFDK